MFRANLVSKFTFYVSHDTFQFVSTGCRATHFISFQQGAQFLELWLQSFSNYTMLGAAVKLNEIPCSDGFEAFLCDISDF